MEWCASPNHGVRKGDGAIDLLLLHYTGMPDALGSLRWLCDRRSQVSAHYLIFEDGRVVHMVEEDRRAWHAGVSYWAGESDINSRSIGIELANPGSEFGYRPFPDRQIDALIDLASGILARHPIPATRVLAHSDVAPARKQDPGALFPWDRLHAAGIGHFVPAAETPTAPAMPNDEELADRFRACGYGVGIHGQYRADLKQVITAFQRHFRPALVDGNADAETVDVLNRLLAARPPAA